jgi:hypothetical protein
VGIRAGLEAVGKETGRHSLLPLFSGLFFFPGRRPRRGGLEPDCPLSPPRPENGQGIFLTWWGRQPCGPAEMQSIKGLFPPSKCGVAATPPADSLTPSSLFRLLPAMDLSATTASSSDLRAIRTGQEHERCASRSPMLGERAGESCEMKRGRQSDRRRLYASDAGRPRALPWRCPGGAAWWPAPPTIGPSSAPRVPHFNLQTLRGRTAGGLPLNFPGPRREWAGQISSRQPPARARGAKKRAFSSLTFLPSLSLPTARPAAPRNRSLAADRRPHRRRDGADGGELRVDSVRPIWLDVAGGER